MNRFALTLALVAVALPHAANAEVADTGSEPGVEPVRPGLIGGGTVGAVQVVAPEDIAEAEFAAAIAPFVGRTLADDDAQDLLTAISNVARRKGYAFATSTIPPQAFAAGILSVVVSEGRIDEVRLEGTKADNVARLLAPLIGRPGRRDELDRLLTLAGDFPGIAIGRVRYEIEDGRGILIVPVSRDRVKGWESIDNRGSEALGPVRMQLAIDFAGLASSDDRLTVQGVVTPLDPTELAVASARYAIVSVDAQTEFAVAATYARTRAGGRWASHDPRGETVGVNASITRTLERSRSVSLWAAADFNFVRSDNWWNGALSQRDRIASVGLSINGYAPLAGGRLRSGIEMRQGLEILGATPAGDPIASRRGAGSDYTLLRSWLNWTGSLHGPFSARLALSSQLTTNPLLAIDQITLGGAMFGRGYNYGERAGDEGALASVEIRGDLLNRTSGPLRWVQLYGFADAGVVRYLRDGFGAGDLYSAGAGARVRFTSDIGLEVEAALPLNASRYDSGDRSPRLSASVGAQF